MDVEESGRIMFREYSNMVYGSFHATDDEDETDNDNGDSPFIARTSEKQFTVVMKMKKRKCTYSAKTVAFTVVIATVLVLLCFIAGLLIGYYVNKKSQKSSICSNPPVLLVSLDGFRVDYLDRDLTPNIISLANAGVRSEYMFPSFPSKTFPNHFSIVTGLYPESHGIIDNFFLDRNFNETFSMSDTDPKWWLGEPVWVTASKEGLKTAVYYWPGSEVPIEGIYPDIYFIYNGSTPFDERIDTVLSWFDLPDRSRPQFMAAYFNEPDHSGHKEGPNSTLVNDALQRVDTVIEKFINGLKGREIYDCVNFIILSDHGMATVTEEKQVVLVPDILPETYCNETDLITYGIFSNLYVHDSDPDVVAELYDLLSQNVDSVNAPIDVYLREGAPPEFHIAEENQQRYGDIFLIAKVGAYIKLKTNKPSFVNIGNHGYDNRDPKMRTIFISHGPAFKSGYLAQPFENIEVYNLLCDLLHIPASSNNGTEGSLADILN